ncbi:MAG: hypothetical protein NVSMB4_18780 [Acidimicrobiales bacterium]
MTRHQRVGAALVVTYLTVCIATIGLSHRQVRPLFEGIGPAPPYRWVKPPAVFAAGNVAPAPSRFDVLVALLDNPNQAQSDDGQISINLPAHPVRLESSDRLIRASFTPRDPLTLGHFPAGSRPVGNAYLVRLTAEPGGRDLGPLAAPGNVTLTVPEPNSEVYFSPDGQSWRSVLTTILGGGTSLGAEFTQPGWYAGGTSSSNPGIGSPQQRSARHVGTLVVAGITLTIAVVLFGVPVIIRRRRANRSVVQKGKPRPSARGAPDRKGRR